MGKNIVLEGGKRHATSKILSNEFSWTEVSTKSTTYVSEYDFVFRGSTKKGVPLDMKIIGKVDDITRPAQVRVVDLGTGLTIAESAAFTNIADAIIDLGVISNVGTVETIYDVQLRRTTGGGNSQVYLKALSIEYGY